MAADQKVRLVNRAWPGRWMFQRQDDQGRQVYTDKSSEAILFTPEMAVHLRDKLRALGNNVFVEDPEGNTLFERESSPPTGPDNRQPQYVTFTNGKVLLVTPAIRPKGQCWAIRAVDIPAFRENGKHTAIESVFGSSPEEAAQKAVDIHGQQILFADPNAAARAEQERQQAEKQKNRPPVNLRPGDRR